MDQETKPLCLFCQSLSPYVYWIAHCPRFSDFQRSAESCPLCKLLLDLMDPSDLDMIQQWTEGPSLYIKVIISNLTREKGFALHRPQISTPWSTLNGNSFIMTTEAYTVRSSSCSCWQPQAGAEVLHRYRKLHPPGDLAKPRASYLGTVSPDIDRLDF